MLQVPQDDVKEGALLFRLKKRWDLCWLSHACASQLEAESTYHFDLISKVSNCFSSCPRLLLWTLILLFSCAFPSRSMRCSTNLVWSHPNWQAFHEVHWECPFKVPRAVRICRTCDILWNWDIYWQGPDYVNTLCIGRFRYKLSIFGIAKIPRKIQGTVKFCENHWPMPLFNFGWSA